MSGRIVWPAAIATLLALAAVTGGQPATAPTDETSPEVAVENEDNVEQRSREAATPTRDPLLSFDRPLHEGVRRWKQSLREATGLDLAIESTTIYQAATGDRDVRDAAVNTTALSGTWVFADDPDDEDGMGIGFNLETRGNFRGDTAADLAADLGSLWSPNDATSDDYTKVGQLWFGHRLLDGRFVYLVGKIDPGAYMGGNRFAGSGNRQFFSQPLAGNPARTFPDNGLGVIARVMPSDHWHVQLAVSDSDANSNHSPFTSLEGRWFYAAELALKPTFDLLGPGNYRVLAYYRDSDPEPTHGIAVSLDQNLGEEFGVFARYGINDGDLAGIEQVLSGGVSLLRPFGRSDDEAGVGGSWARPSDAGLRDQFATEAYYRVQLSDLLELSASAQLIFDPDESTVAVFGVRLRLLL